MQYTSYRTYSFNTLLSYSCLRLRWPDSSHNKAVCNEIAVELINRGAASEAGKASHELQPSQAAHNHDNPEWHPPRKRHTANQWKH